MPGAEDSYHLIRVQDAQANSKADTFFIAPKELGTENSPVHRIVLQTLAGEITGDVEISSLTGDGLSVDADGNLTADADAPDDAEYVLLSPDPDLAGAQVHSNLSGEELHDPADHSATHESGGDDSLDLGSLDVLSNLDLDGNAILDSERGVVVIDANDLQLDDGQSIRDESANERLELQAARTVLSNDAGRAGFSASETAGVSARPDSGRPWFVRDVEGGFNGYIYRPSSSAPGTLELANALLDLNSNDIVGVGDLTATGEVDINTSNADAISLNAPAGDTSQIQLNWGHDGGSLSWGAIASQAEWFVFDYANDVRRLDISAGGPVAVENSDLQIDEGQSIQDDSGIQRLSVKADRTQMRDTDGNVAFNAKGNNADFPDYQILPDSDKDFAVFDKQMSDTAYIYKSSASPPGTLELTNAQLFAPDVVGTDRGGQVGSSIEISNESGADFSNRLSFTADGDGDGDYGTATLFYDDNAGELKVEINGTVTTLA